MIRAPITIQNEHGAWLGAVSIADKDGSIICIFPRNRDDPTRAERNAQAVYSALMGEPAKEAK